MAKRKNAVDVYQLICDESGARNYVLRLKKEHKGLKVKKYCPKLKRHTMHSAKKA